MQNWAAQKVAAHFSKKLQTKVSIKYVSFSLFNKLRLEGVLVEDRQKDTLLYAGEAKINITDWFFLKDEATIKYVGLSDAVVNMKRTDSVWNYQFLVDYFSSPKKSKSSSGSSIDFGLKVLELKNIRFNKIDKWAGQDMVVSLGKLDLDADILDFKNKQVVISRLDLDKPFFFQSNYTGLRPRGPENLGEIAQKIPVISALKWNTGDWKVTVKKLHVNQASFANERETERAPYVGQFDGQHLLFTDISGDLNNVQFKGDTLTANINLAAKEKSGFAVKKIQSNLRFTPDIMEFGDLLLETNQSRITNYYSMQYKDFSGDLNNFLHNVVLEGRFDNSVIASDDIAFFAPSLKTWKRTFQVNGTAKGTVDNISAKKLVLKSGNTYVDGDIALRGLPDIKTTFIDFKSNDLQTNYQDMTTIIPLLKKVTQPKLSQLGNIRFKGNFTGFITDFVAFGNIQTSLGSLNADLNMKLPEKGTPVYSGKISSPGFNLGRFLNSNDLGTVALDGKISGTGFNRRDLDMNFDGKVHRLDLNGYSYQNITVKGDFKQNLFSGHLSINDPNLKIDDLTGSLTLSRDETKFSFDALLKYANLKNLKLTDENFTLNGNLNVDFEGNNIDNFLGAARVYNASLTHDSTRLSFDSLVLRSSINSVTGQKVLTLQSNEFEGDVTGDFKIMELPSAFQLFLNRYYPTYIKKPTHTISNQDFSFLFKTRQVDEYVKLLDKRLGGFNNSTFSGDIKIPGNQLNFSADVPEFSYDGKRFSDVVLKSKGDLDSLSTSITMSDVYLSDSLHLPNTQLTISSSNDISNVTLKTSASKTLSDAQLNARVQTLSDGVSIDFFNSSFIINDKKWNLEKDGHLTIRKSYIEARDVRFTSGNQEIVISTEMDELTDHTNLIARIRKVNIGDFTPFFLKQPKLEGVLTGTIILKEPFGRQIVEFDAEAEDFALDGKRIGTTKIKGDLNPTSGILNIDANADDTAYKFSVKGSINIKDTTGNGMNLDFVADRFDVSILDNYLGSVFSGLQGDAKSNLKISSENGRRTLTGSVTITGGALTVKYTQCKYLFDNETIIFNPDEIDIGTLQLRDTLGNTGTASGKIQHQFFSEFGFDRLLFKTDNDRMLLLNTTRRDNSQFYGKVFGRATLTLDGPVTDMRMNIDGAPSTVDSSHIYLLTGTSSRESGTIDYIEFIQYGAKMEDAYIGKKESNMTVNINVTANPACKVDVILDEETGDAIRGSGDGKLNITVGTREPLRIYGGYNITNGQYTFNFQTLLKKFFTVRQGSITWNGDPLEARVNIEAEYLAEKVDVTSLNPSYIQREDITIVARISGTLKKPEIKFDFKFAENSALSKDFFALKKIDDIKNDNNEMFKQVASLLLVNSFISTDQSFLTGGNTLALATNTIGGIISGWLSNLFNKELEKATNGILSTYFDINSSLDLQRAALLQANVSAGFKIVLSRRLIVLIGGNLDYNNPYASLARKGLLTPDINIEWLLNKDGSLRVVGFNRTSVDLTFGQRNRSGVKLSYRKDFDKLFLSREERKKRQLRKKEMEEKMKKEKELEEKKKKEEELRIVPINS